MSAFMCSDAHFDVLATFASARRIDLYLRAGTKAYAESMEVFGTEHPNLTFQASLVGAVLRDQNARSVEYRYEDCRTSNDMGTKDAYRYRPATHWTPAMILNAVRCLRYQSCETPEYDTTLAAAILEHIESDAIRMITEGEPWGIEEEHIRPRLSRTA